MTPLISNHPDLFTPAQTALPPAVPYQRGSETSREAALRVAVVARGHEQLTYEAIVAAGTRGTTRKQLAADLAFAANQQNRITGRVDSLIKKKLIREVHVLAYHPDGLPYNKLVKLDGSAVIVVVGL